MAKKHKEDPLVFVIAEALELGDFISYKESWGFIDNLKSAKEKIDRVVEAGDAKRSVSLYEMFLSGCYEKAEEIDDSSGSLGMFFEELFCSWIKARQKGGCVAEETVHQILKWKDNDGYGFCYNIEPALIKVLNRKGLSVFEICIKSRFDEGFSAAKSGISERIYNDPYDVRQNADILKLIYVAKKDVESYLALCEKVGTTPRDCENIANIYIKKRRSQDALIWVDKGLSLEKADTWPNESGRDLSTLKRELLNDLGQKGDALESAWSEFKAYPSEFSYDELMKYVSKKDRKHWHNRAIEEVKKASLPGTIELCTKTQEWEILAECIDACKHEDLESISHYSTEKAAQGLERKYPTEAAKIYRAMGKRIVKAKKSKYYGAALSHFLKTKKLYLDIGRREEWLSLVENVRRDHYRKYSLMGDFEELVSGNYPESPESFEERTRKRWEKQISDKD